MPNLAEPLYVILRVEGRVVAVQEAFSVDLEKWHMLTYRLNVFDEVYANTASVLTVEFSTKKP